MKSKLCGFFLGLAFVIPAVCLARWNPAVQNIFFEELEKALPSQQPPPLASAGGTISVVSYPGLAWAVDNVKNSHRPLIISFNSVSSDCIRWNVNHVDDCPAQSTADVDIANHYAGTVDVVVFNVQLHPQVMNGPDVQALPSHIFIADYTDSQHYTAIKVWGLMDEQGLEQTIQQTFNIAP
ncbi:MAG TPA: hypothetical protein V6C81_13140 [Planktothrix sp.]|jgi:hypothetical protein